MPFLRTLLQSLLLASTLALSLTLALVPAPARAEAPVPASAASEAPAYTLPPDYRPVPPNLPTAIPPANPPGNYPAQALPWFEEVRDQRRMLANLRRAQRDVEQDARKEEFLRRRQERLELIDQDRRLFLNYGPWLEPMAPVSPTHLPPAPLRADVPTNTPANTPDRPPAGWDNGWYFNGW